jgi:hypothetical protein
MIEVVPKTKDQGVTIALNSKVIINDLALPVSLCVGAQVEA